MTHLPLLEALCCSGWSPRICWNSAFIVPLPLAIPKTIVCTTTSSGSGELFQRTVFPQQLAENIPFFGVPFSVGCSMPKCPCAGSPHKADRLKPIHIVIPSTFHNKKLLLSHCLYCHQLEYYTSLTSSKNDHVIMFLSMRYMQKNVWEVSLKGRGLSSPPFSILSRMKTWNVELKQPTILSF